MKSERRFSFTLIEDTVADFLEMAESHLERYEEDPSDTYFRPPSASVDLRDVTIVATDMDTGREEWLSGTLEVLVHDDNPEFFNLGFPNHSHTEFDFDDLQRSDDDGELKDPEADMLEDMRLTSALAVAQMLSEIVQATFEKKANGKKMDWSSLAKCRYRVILDDNGKRERMIPA